MKKLKFHWCVYVFISFITSILMWFQGCIVSDAKDDTKMAEIFKFHFSQSQYVSLGFNLIITLMWFLNTYFLYS